MTRGFAIPVEKIERARALRGWSVSELARRSGVGLATASRALTGQPVTMATLARLAAAFSKHPPIPSVRALLDGEEVSDEGLVVRPLGSQSIGRLSHHQTSAPDGLQPAGERQVQQ